MAPLHLILYLPNSRRVDIYLRGYEYVELGETVRVWGCAAVSRGKWISRSGDSPKEALAKTLGSIYDLYTA